MCHCGSTVLGGRDRWKVSLAQVILARTCGWPWWHLGYTLGHSFLRTCECGASFTSCLITSMTFSCRTDLGQPESCESLRHRGIHRLYSMVFSMLCWRRWLALGHLTSFAGLPSEVNVRCSQAEGLPWFIHVSGIWWHLYWNHSRVYIYYTLNADAFISICTYTAYDFYIIMSLWVYDYELFRTHQIHAHPITSLLQGQFLSENPAHLHCGGPPVDIWSLAPCIAHPWSSLAPTFSQRICEGIVLKDFKTQVELGQFGYVMICLNQGLAGDCRSIILLLHLSCRNEIVCISGEWFSCKFECNFWMNFALRCSTQCSLERRAVFGILPHRALRWQNAVDVFKHELCFLQLSDSATLTCQYDSQCASV